jgi:small subunit ribosomal protein S1
VFIDLGGIDGLVHKSELSWNKVNNPEAGYKVGDEVEAEVIDINHERGRISLSIRRLQPDPWNSTVADFNVGDVIDGTVTKLVNFGAFVRVREGLEGLIHISELSHQRVAHPGDVVHEGQQLKLKIISLDSDRHRLGLSLKQAEEPPARPAPEPGQAAPAAPPRGERRPRQERGWSASDAIQEPEGGIDNTLAAAFAQVRDQLAASEAAQADTDDGGPDAPAATVAETDGFEGTAATEAPAEAAAAEDVAEPQAATEPAEPVTAEAEPVTAEAEPVTAEAEPVTAEAEPADDAATSESSAAPVETAEAEPAEAVAEPVMDEAPADAAEETPTADAAPEPPVAEAEAADSAAQAAEADAPDAGEQPAMEAPAADADDTAAAPEPDDDSDKPTA